MNIVNLIRISLSALVNNKFRALLTMLGIIIGVASVIAMLAIGQGSRQSIQDQISRMGTNMLIIQPGSGMFRGARTASSGSQTLELADYEAIRKECPDISYVSPLVNANGQAIYGASNWPVAMQGVNTEYPDIRKIDIADGRMFSERDIRTAAKVCLLGKTVIDNLFGENADPVGLSIRYNKIPFKVIGTLAPKGENAMGQDQDNLILAPYTTVQKRLLGITYLNDIFASAVSENLTDQARIELETVMREQHKLGTGVEDDFNVRSQEEILAMFSNTSNILTTLLAVIASISLVVGGIGIMNIMFVSVTERTREIGLRMAVGARGMDILTQFLIEAVLISVIGGIIGILLGTGSSFIIKDILNWPISISTFSIVLSFIVCSVTGVFFGWYPAKKAADLDPIDAIRYE
jgi:putative ABC transport system permease protein